jgi:hypothetical protein
MAHASSLSLRSTKQAQPVNFPLYAIQEKTLVSHDKNLIIDTQMENILQNLTESLQNPLIPPHIFSTICTLHKTSDIPPQLFNDLNIACNQSM